MVKKIVRLQPRYKLIKEVERIKSMKSGRLGMVNRIYDAVIEKIPDAGIISLNGEEAKERELMRELALLESEYLGAVKSEALLKLEKQKSDFVMPTEEELNKQAAESVNPKYDNIAQKTQNKYGSALDRIEYDILNAEIEKSEKERKLALEGYGKEKALKEEIARKNIGESSIAELSEAMLGQGITEDKRQLAASYAAEKANLESKAASLEKEYELALDNYEISRAAELKREAAELYGQAEKQALEAERLNNKIELEKQEYLANFRNIIAEQELIDAAEGYTGLKKENYEKRYGKAKDFYSILDKATALRMINDNPTLRDKLGIYYEKLIQEIQRS